MGAIAPFEVEVEKINAVRSHFGTVEEKELAKKLKKSGLSYREVAMLLKRDIKTIFRWLNPDYHKSVIERNKRWQKLHPDKVREYSKKTYLRHGKEYSKRRYSKHKQEILKKGKEWRRKNRTLMAKFCREWRNRNMNGRVNRFLHGHYYIDKGKKKKSAGFLEGQGMCIICGELFPLALEGHHIGKSVWTLCGTCHNIIHKFPYAINERMSW
jgi:hypothetical protein